ncbi:MAG: uridine kinase [Verrucomicrobiota bacterium]
MSKPASSAPLLVGIAGGTGSGKSEFAASLLEALQPHATLISQDWYYRDRAGVSPEAALKLNFDHPAAIDNALLRKHLLKLKARQEIHTPRYDYANHRRLASTVPVTHSPIILIEGILILHDARLRSLFDLSVFIDVPADVRLMRRIHRDVNARGIPVDETLRLYEVFARPMHERFVQPSACHATLVWSQLTDRRFPERLKSHLKQLLPKQIRKPA